MVIDQEFIGLQHHYVNVDKMIEQFKTLTLIERRMEL